MEPFDLVKIRNKWLLAGFRDLQKSDFGQRHNCVVILKNEITSKYSGALYYNGKAAVDPVFYLNSEVSLRVITRALLYFKDNGWLPMEKNDLETVFCGRKSNRCTLI